LSANGDKFMLTYQDTFKRIILRNEDIQTVLNDEAGQLEDLLNAAKAGCWAPDPPRPALGPTTSIECLESP
jgi:multiple sugar transport system substrate-binding protein